MLLSIRPTTWLVLGIVLVAGCTSMLGDQSKAPAVAAGDGAIPSPTHGNDTVSGGSSSQPVPGSTNDTRSDQLASPPTATVASCPAHNCTILQAVQFQANYTARMNLTKAKVAIEADGYAPYQEDSSFLGTKTPSDCTTNCTTFMVNLQGNGTTVYVSFSNPDAEQRYDSLAEARARGEVFCGEDGLAFNQTLAAFEARTGYYHDGRPACTPLLVTPP